MNVGEGGVLILQWVWWAAYDQVKEKVVMMTTPFPRQVFLQSDGRWGVDKSSLGWKRERILVWKEWQYVLVPFQTERQSPIVQTRKKILWICCLFRWLHLCNKSTLSEKWYLKYERVGLGGLKMALKTKKSTIQHNVLNCVDVLARSTCHSAKHSFDIYLNTYLF